MSDILAIQRFYNRRNDGDETERAECLKDFCVGVVTYGRIYQETLDGCAFAAGKATEQFQEYLQMIDDDEKEIASGRLTPEAYLEIQRLKDERAKWQSMEADIIPPVVDSLAFIDEV